MRVANLVFTKLRTALNTLWAAEDLEALVKNVLQPNWLLYRQPG